MSDERQQLENSLLHEFWGNVQKLTSLLAQHSYLLAVCNAGNADDPDVTVPEDMVNSFSQLMPLIHNSVQITYIQYRTIEAATSKKIVLGEREKVLYGSFDKLKESVLSSRMVPFKLFEDYVVCLNVFIAMNVLKNVLQTGKEKAMDSYAQALVMRGEASGSSRKKD